MRKIKLKELNRDYNKLNNKLNGFSFKFGSSRLKKMLGLGLGALVVGGTGYALYKRNQRNKIPLTPAEIEENTRKEQERQSQLDQIFLTAQEKMDRKNNETQEEYNARQLKKAQLGFEKWVKKQPKYNKLQEAKESGNIKKYNKRYNKLLKEYKRISKVKTSLKSGLKKMTPYFIRALTYLPIF